MGFDLASATPVETSGFDLASAKPVGVPESSATPPTSPGPQGMGYDLMRGAAGLGETALHVGSQMLAFPAMAGASLYQLANSPGGQKVSNAREAINTVGNAMTYQPRTEEGKNLSNAFDTVLSAPAKLGDTAGDAVTRATGSAGAGALTSTLVQAVPALLGARYAKGRTAPARAAPRVEPTMGPSATAPASAAEQAAQTYVNTRTALDWGSLSDTFKKKLTTVAEDATNLDKLDPEAVARQALLEKLNLRGTRGQVDRSLPQLTEEENLTKSDAGAPIRDITSSQDTRLHELVSELRDPSAPTTRQGVGTAVQSAAKAKEALHDRLVDQAYTSARQAGETAQIANVAPLEEWLKVPANSRNAGFLKSALKDYMPEDALGVSINDLENIRQEAVARTLGPPSTEGHYAGEAIGVIDKILDNSGGSLYKSARKLYREGKNEFERQRLMRDMVSNKAGTTDRATALEDTFDRVIRTGSAEQLKQFRDSLTTGGDDSTRIAGNNAWKALQGATVDYLRDKAAGKRAIPGEKAQLQFNSTFLDALHDIDADGKLEIIFGVQKAKQVREIAQAVRIVRTKPTGRIAGSDTVPRIIATLQRASDIPGVGPFIGGTVKAAQKLHAMGQEGRQVKNALATPLDEAANELAKPKKYRKAIRSSSAGAGVAGAEERK